MFDLPEAQWVSPRFKNTRATRKLKPKLNIKADLEDPAEIKPPRIFFFGENHELALYRAHTLESIGCNVVIPQTKAEALSIIDADGLSAAILSYTLSDETVKELADLIRQTCADCPLLIISKSATNDPHVQPDFIIHADEGPFGLISAVRYALAKRVQ